METSKKWKTAALLAGIPAALAVSAYLWSRRSRQDPGPGPHGLLFPVPEALYPFQHRFLDLEDGIHIHYVDEGPPDAAHTIVFLHGNPTWSFLYRNIIRELRSTYRCIAPDYPNFGLSTAPGHRLYRPAEQSRIIETFLDELRPGSFTLMVHDWGGPIGLGLAGRRPELIERLIVANTWAWPVDGDRDKIRFSKLFGGPVGRFLGLNFNGITQLFLRLGTARKLSDTELEMYLRPFRYEKRRHSTVVFPREITAADTYMRQVAAGLHTIATRPTLIIWGAADISSSLTDKARFEEIFPNHTTLLLPKARHFVQEDAPAEISAAIREFLGAPLVSGTDDPLIPAYAAHRDS